MERLEASVVWENVISGRCMGRCSRAWRRKPTVPIHRQRRCQPGSCRGGNQVDSPDPGARGACRPRGEAVEPRSITRVGRRILRVE